MPPEHRRVVKKGTSLFGPISKRRANKLSGKKKKAEEPFFLFGHRAAHSKHLKIIKFPIWYKKAVRARVRKRMWSACGERGTPVFINEINQV